MTDPAAEDRALVELVRTLKSLDYHFVTPTPMTHSRVNTRPDNRTAQDLPGVFGWSRPFARETVPDAVFRLMGEAGVLRQKDAFWQSDVRVSSLCGELLVHSSFPTDAPDAVFFGPDTYRFANALRAGMQQRTAPLRRAVDIGCGSGAGALLVARANPAAEVLALDINPAALRLTRVNAEAAGLGNVEARHSDLLSAVDGDLDLIIANPPYLIDADERTYRHGGGPLGAGLSLAIVDASLARLAPGGRLLLYTGVAMQANADPFRAAVAERLEGRGLDWDYSELDPDVFGEELLLEPYTACDRIAAVWLQVTRPA